MNTKLDSLALRGTEHNTSGAALGRVEQRSQSASPARREPSAAAQELNEALSDTGLPSTDDLLFLLGAELGYSTTETRAAVLSGMRAGLFLDAD